MHKSISIGYALAVAISYGYPVPGSENGVDAFGRRHDCGMMGCGGGSWMPGNALFLAGGLQPNTQFVGPGFMDTTVYPDITFSAVHGGGGMLGFTTPQAPPVAPSPPEAPPAQECGQSQAQPCQELEGAAPEAPPSPPAPEAPPSPPAPEAPPSSPAPEAPPSPPAQQSDQSQAQPCQESEGAAPPSPSPQPVTAPPSPPAPPAQECDQNAAQPCQESEGAAPPPPPAPPAQECDQNAAQPCQGVAPEAPPPAYNYSSNQSNSVAASTLKDNTVYVHNKEESSVNSSSNSNTNFSYGG